MYITKLLKFTSIFYKIRDKINIDVAKMIYFAFIHSHLVYGIEIYGNTYINHLNRLIILNNKLLRILQKAPRDTPVVKLYANFNTLTLPDLHTYHTLKFVHNCIYHQNNCHTFSPIILLRIICSISITPALESTFILNRQIVPWGRDLSNLKEVACGILSQMNLSP